MSADEFIKKLNESTFRGVPGTKFISHGDWSDPEISTTVDNKTYTANYWDVENSMHGYYLDEKEYSETHDDKHAEDLKNKYTFDDSDEDFEKFLKDHSSDVINDISEMGKLEEELNESDSQSKSKNYKMYQLSDDLYATVQGMIESGVTNIKEYEHELQKCIEDAFPGKSWWDVCDCNIFMSLFEGRDPDKTVDEILKSIKSDSLTESNLEITKPKEFIELSTFKKSWSNLGLTDDDLNDLQILIMKNENITPLGTNVYKIEFSPKHLNKGKNTSDRVIYIEYIKDSKVYLVLAFSKSDEANITKTELKQIRELSKNIK